MLSDNHRGTEDRFDADKIGDGFAHGFAEYLLWCADLNDHPAFHHGNTEHRLPRFLVVVSDKQCGFFGVTLKEVLRLRRFPL